MRNSLGRVNISQATPISSNGALQDKVGRLNPTDLFSVGLSDRSRFNLKLRSSGQGAKVYLGQDLNQNNQLDTDEILSQTIVRAKRNQSLQLDLEAGNYVIQVDARGRGTTRYRLKLATTAIDSSTSPNPQPPTTQPQTTGSVLKTLTDRVVQLTNDYRRQNGLAPLTVNVQLTQAAQAHSRNMALQDFVSHKDPNGMTPGDRATAAGYEWLWAAENIAGGFAQAEAVMQGWIDSPGHRANLLNPDLQEIGVGYFFLATDTGRSNYNHYWAQAFGTPKSS